ncbi:MAG: zf-HC2 domain-containing protein [Chloracidobacterium sp.]
MPTNHSSSAACDRGPDLMAYLYGEASPAERADIERHLQTCATCRAELEGFQAVRTALQSWEMDAIAPRLQLTLAPSPWQAWREFWATLPRWSRLAAGAAAMLVVCSLANVRVTIGAQGVTVATGWFGRSEVLPTGAADVAIPTVETQRTAAAPPSSLDEAAFRRIAAQVVAESVAEQSSRRDAEVDARLKTVLDARLKQQRAELLRLIGQLNREQRLQVAAWIQESERRTSPDLLDLVSTFPSAEAEGDE